MNKRTSYEQDLIDERDSLHLVAWHPRVAEMAAEIAIELGLADDVEDIHGERAFDDEPDEPFWPDHDHREGR